MASITGNRSPLTTPTKARASWMRANACEMSRFDCRARSMRLLSVGSSSASHQVSSGAARSSMPAVAATCQASGGAEPSGIGVSGRT